MKLWASDGKELDGSVEDFLSGSDVQHDQELVEWDILGSIAQAQMLHEQGYLSEQELGEIHSALLKLYETGIKLEPGDEDVHTKIEALVTKDTEAGKKIHAGRSRNDQVAADERMYIKKNIIGNATAAVSLVEALSGKSVQEAETPMPGYTHVQKAMPTTVGTWLGSFAEALIDDLQQLEAIYKVADQSPLGAAAGYGTTLDIDRERTAELLGFSKVQENPVYSVGSRKTIALKAVQALSQLMLDVQVLANDLLLFSTQEFGFVEVPEEFCTGSSIMPQKKNPDVLEMVKGKTAEVLGNQHAIETVCSGAHSGYGRETQAVKGPVMESFRTVQETLHILAGLVEGLEFNKEKLEASMDDSMYAAHTANQKVEVGVPFREAYRGVKENQKYEELSPEDIPSSTVNQESVSKMEKGWTEKKEEMEQTLDYLVSLAEENAAND